MLASITINIDIYFGIQSLNRYLPCSSSPCLHGKDCINGPTEGQFHCECPLENIGLKFFDDKCTAGKKDC